MHTLRPEVRRAAVMLLLRTRSSFPARSLRCCPQGSAASSPVSCQPACDTSRRVRAVERVLLPDKGVAMYCR